MKNQVSEDKKATALPDERQRIREAIVDVVTDDIRNNGPIRQLIQQVAEEGQVT